MSNMVDAVEALNYEVSRLFNVEENLRETTAMLKIAHAETGRLREENRKLKSERKSLAQVEKRHDALIEILERTKRGRELYARLTNRKWLFEPIIDEQTIPF